MTVKPTAPVMVNHAKWCVRPNHTGQCSEKRGHWDRSTNTWESDMTQKDRSAIADALLLWKSGRMNHREAAQYVRDYSDTLTSIPDGAIMSWNMTQKKNEKEGRSWPLPEDEL